MVQHWKQAISNTNYSLNTETVNANFRPTTKLGLFVNQSYADNLDGYRIKVL